MTIETVLTDQQITLIHYENAVGEFDQIGLCRAIEQAVLQSDEVKRLRGDAERYRWLRKRMIAVDFEYGDPKCIALAFEMPGRDMAFSANCDANVDLGMEKQP